MFTHGYIYTYVHTYNEGVFNKSWNWNLWENNR